ncbi:ABC transporter ATP-binding protein [Celerinatantimonas sp. MCCC 1A17872]|uniref:ABC transporter ATP-binding protein n=1 Tax=Celerinatantimonas sp. MCCC 1A17872 TaxID=3177514 RepID=UPI0038BF869B
MYKLSDIKVIRGNRAILDVPNLSIPTDKFTVILGHNGSGKSTMMSLLSGQQTPEQGQITLNGQSVSEYKSKELAKAVAFLPQKLPNSAGLTVQELVKLGRFPWRGALGRWKEEDYQIIDNAMQRTKIDGFANTLADELSGGERQRAWISMLLAQQSPLLLLDEPTSALDIQHQYQLMELLFELNHDNQYGVVAILHDLNLALRYADHIIALKQGQIAFAGDAQLLEDEQRLSDLYQTPIKLLDHPQSNSAQATKVAIVCP